MAQASAAKLSRCCAIHHHKGRNSLLLRWINAHPVSFKLHPSLLLLNCLPLNPRLDDASCSVNLTALPITLISTCFASLLPQLKLAQDTQYLQAASLLLNVNEL